MIDTTIKAYATRQLGCVVLAASLATGLLLLSEPSGLAARAANEAAANSEPNSGPNSGMLRTAPIGGDVRIVDGDTIVLGGVRIRLEGIDAPETGQTCTTHAGHVWSCGREATAVLTKIIGGQPVTCDERGLDKYRRVLAVCHAGGIDINARMVQLGYAWAFVRYSKAYVADEAEAREAKRGIWSGEAIPAWDYRAGSWQSAEPAAPNGCAIKGNVTANGKIYHLPWSPWYGKVKMDGDRGKRWFCSEADAVAAGWRPAQLY